VCRLFIASINACYQMIFITSIPWSRSKTAEEAINIKSSSTVTYIAVISGSELISWSCI